MDKVTPLQGRFGGTAVQAICTGCGRWTPAIAGRYVFLGPIDALGRFLMLPESPYLFAGARKATPHHFIAVVALSSVTIRTQHAPVPVKSGLNPASLRGFAPPSLPALLGSDGDGTRDRSPKSACICPAQLVSDLISASLQGRYDF